MSRLGTAFLTIYDAKDGDSPTYVRYYSNYPGLLSEMGDPDDSPPNTTVGWTSFTTTAPSTAYWIAEKRTVGETVYGWILTAVQSKTGGLPFVKYEMLSTTAPTDPFGTGLSTWETHAIEAVEAFTGRDYTDPKEFGYGTTIVIDYANNATVAGTYKRDETNGTDEWEAPSQFIDGSLVVDGSIVAAKIAANSIDANKIVVTGSAAIETAAAAATRATGTLTDAATDAASKVAVVTDNIYAENTTEINGGKIATDTITADAIDANTITATEMAASSVKAITIDLDDTLNLLDDNSGIASGKTSLSDFSNDGIYIGNGTDTSNNQISGINVSGGSSVVSFRSDGTFAMAGVELYGTVTTGTAIEYSTSGSYSLDVSTLSTGDNITIEIIGGGGGAGHGAYYNYPSDRDGTAGGAGGDTIIVISNSTSGNVTYTATGGTGGPNDPFTGSVSDYRSSSYGEAGESSYYGSGGSAGGDSRTGDDYSSAEAGGDAASTAYGAGGGGHGAYDSSSGTYHRYSSYGGHASSRSVINYSKRAGDTTISITVGVKGVGAGPPSGDGAAGYAKITPAGVTFSDPIDFDDFFILPSNSDMVGLSSITSSSHNSYHSAPQGAGWYWVSGLVGYGSSYWSQQGFVPWGVDIYNNGGALSIRHYGNNSATLYYKKLS